MTTTSVSGNGSAFQFSGVASGLDTAGIINQLMTVEALPQTNLKNAVAAQQAQVSALQSVNSALAAVSTQADSFKTGSTWTKLTATSSSSTVSVSASSAASQGALTLTVNSPASAAQLTYSAQHALSDVVATPGSVLQVTMRDGSSASVATGDGKLSTVIAALNGIKDANGKQQLVASAVNVGGGNVQLLVSAAGTGAGSISISDPSGAPFFSAVTATAGSDASITLGAGITATSSTNTFTSLLPGVDVTLGAGTPTGQPITITVADDGSSRANGVNTFLGSINSLFSQIATATSYGTVGAGGSVSGGGVLAGNLDMRDLTSRLVNTVFPPNGTSLAAYGLDVDRTGTLTFDHTKFEAAYQADPVGVQKALTDWVARVQTVADDASLPSSGTLSQSIKSMNDRIRSENDDIASWDDRLALKQSALEHTYTNLETQLSKLKAQQSWLSSALAALDGTSSNSH